jgi:hypothetical protein
MPYENLMPYMPLSQPTSLTSLLERARLNREQSERDDVMTAQGYDDPGARIRGEMDAMHRRQQADTFSNNNPSWDAWFQSVNEGTGGKRGSGIIGGGRSAARQNKAIRQDALDGEDQAAQVSPYNVEGQARARGARPSLSALNGISYLQR